MNVSNAISLTHSHNLHSNLRRTLLKDCFYGDTVVKIFHIQWFSINNFIDHHFQIFPIVNSFVRTSIHILLKMFKNCLYINPFNRYVGLTTFVSNISFSYFCSMQNAVWKLSCLTSYMCIKRKRQERKQTLMGWKYKKTHLCTGLCTQIYRKNISRTYLIYLKIIIISEFKIIMIKIPQFQYISAY